MMCLWHPVSIMVRQLTNQMMMGLSQLSQSNLLLSRKNSKPASGKWYRLISNNFKCRHTYSQDDGKRTTKSWRFGLCIGSLNEDAKVYKTQSLIQI